MLHPSEWLIVKKEGLFCIPGSFYIDPKLPVDYAVITHAHADHAIKGHRHVLATPETIKILKLRYGKDFAESCQPLCVFDKITHKDMIIRLLPAGHILGSAQIELTYRGQRVIFSGDYKRSPDPTCLAFFPSSCDVFITEATFGLPIFIHPPIAQEIFKLIHSIEQHPSACHVIGAYTLGKCQRLIAELRHLGYQAPIYVQPAKYHLCQAYQTLGIELGKVERFDAQSDFNRLKGRLFIVSPSSIHDRWLNKLSSPIRGLATGWMRVRARAKQQLVELPLIISDHADWNELTRTLLEINPQEIWVTHGQEDAIVYFAQTHGLVARALDIWRDEMEAEA